MNTTDLIAAAKTAQRDYERHVAVIQIDLGCSVAEARTIAWLEGMDGYVERRNAFFNEAPAAPPPTGPAKTTAQ